jgi:hypothetical protein
VCCLLGEGHKYDKVKNETLLKSGKEVGLEAESEKTKYMTMPRRQNESQNHNTKTANRPFESKAKSNLLRPTLANQNCTHEEITY